MLILAVMFIIAGVVFGLVGFAGATGSAVWIAKAAFFVFLAAFYLSLIHKGKPRFRR